MVAETGEANEKYLRAVAAGSIDLKAATDARAREALTTIAAEEAYGQLSRGALMTTVDSAADTLVRGFLERHAASWEAERRLHGVSDDAWLSHLASLLARVTEAGAKALQEDEFDAEAYASQEEAHLKFVRDMH